MSYEHNEEFTKEQIRLWEISNTTEEDAEIILDLKISDVYSFETYDIFVRYLDSLNL